MAGQRISVIVPVYGAEAYLDKCIKSITGQTYTDLEIILVDDGSKDRGGEMCDEYALKDERIRVIHKENGGLMSAWIEGVKASTGEYLCFVDSDDYTDTSMIAAMAEHLTGEPEIVCCNYVVEHADGRQEEVRHGAAPGEYTGDKLENDIKRRVLGNENRTISMSRCMKLTSRSLVADNIKYCDTRIRMAEDMNIMLPAILDAQRIYVMEGAFFYHYYYNDESMVHHYDSGMNDNMEYLRSALEKILEDKLPGGSMADELQREELYLFMLQLKNEMRKREDAPVKRMLALINELGIKERTGKYPLRVSDKGNRLLYLLMRHPGILTARLVDTLFCIKNK